MLGKVDSKENVESWLKQASIRVPEIREAAWVSIVSAYSQAGLFTLIPKIEASGKFTDDEMLEIRDAAHYSQREVPSWIYARISTAMRFGIEALSIIERTTMTEIVRAAVMEYLVKKGILER